MHLRTALFIILLSAYCTTALAQSQLDQVSGWVAVQPTSSTVQAHITYAYANGPQAQKQLRLLIDKNTVVRQLSCRNLKRYEVGPDSSSRLSALMNTITIELAKPLAPHALLRIRLAYEGTMTLHTFDGVPLPQNWIESSLNTNCMTPVRADLAPSTYAVEIRTDRSYEVFAPGQVKPRGPGRYAIRSPQPVPGLDFILGQGLCAETYSWGTNAITLVSYQASDSLKRGVVEMAGKSLDFYHRTFGRRAPRRDVLIALRPTAVLDASYASGNNYLVTYDPGKGFFTNRPFHFGNISHEIGHFWWHHAHPFTVDRWLNESFAEYVSLRAKREHFGQETFDQEMAALRARVKRLPAHVSLASHDPRSPVANVMAYSKGTLLLHQLEEKWGEARFLAVLTEAAATEIKNRREFIGVVEKILGRVEAAHVEALTEGR